MHTSIEIVHTKAEGEARGRASAILVARQGEVLAILPPGDPLRRIFSLSSDELREIIATFPNVMKGNPHIKALVEAVLESKLANGSLEPSTS